MSDAAYSSRLRARLHSLPERLAARVFGGVLWTPYGRWQQGRLRRSVVRSDRHIYTTFFRSPGQLDALVGPVLDHLAPRPAKEAVQINMFACSTGAEVYSVASELRRCHPELKWHIHASDLHEHTVSQARRARYARDDECLGASSTPARCAQVFDPSGKDWRVKPGIRQRVEFAQLDLLRGDLEACVPAADVVFVQNVLFHMDEKSARRAFAAAVSTMKPRSVLFVEGMELDVRVELTREFGLEPLCYRIREIYEQSRIHVAPRWWNYYYGSEPYCRFARDAKRRYATIFLRS